MKNRVDLHLHSTASDGIRTPTALVQLSLESGLQYVSLTDHDTTGGTQEALNAAWGTPLTVIPGVEKATAIVYMPFEDRFVVRASSGWDVDAMRDIRLTRSEANARYITNSEEVSDDIFVAKNVRQREGAAEMAEFGNVASFLVLRVRVENNVVAYLVFDNLTDAQLLMLQAGLAKKGPYYNDPKKVFDNYTSREIGQLLDEFNIAEGKNLARTVKNGLPGQYRELFNMGYSPAEVKKKIDDDVTVKIKGYWNPEDCKTKITYLLYE